MGIADIVPGVSGGTIAIITGVYEELLKTLDGLNFKIIKKLKNNGFKYVWDYYNFSFLFSLGTGILLSIVILSHFILLLLDNYPIALWSLFLGLITASIFYLINQTERLNFKETKFIIPTNVYFLLIGLFLAVYVQTIKPGNSDISYVYLFFCGMISITAMLLPGISGAYILVLLGAYETMLKTFKEVTKFNSDYFLKFISFSLGAILSIKLFSKFLTWSYKFHKNKTLYCLIGFMIGSLPSLWPWKKEKISSEFFTDNLYVPEGYFSNSEFNQGLIFFIIGVLIVLILELFSNKNEKKR